MPDLQVPHGLSIAALTDNHFANRSPSGTPADHKRLAFLVTKNFRRRKRISQLLDLVPTLIHHLDVHLRVS